jgi:hypothetical protein
MQETKRSHCGQVICHNIPMLKQSRDKSADSMSKPRIPDLFIIGAAKCGTTAMSHYLAGHPDIFMSEQAGVKEPRYFASDFGEKPNRISNCEEYVALFEAAPKSALYLGEASVFYLYSKVAVKNILAVSPNAKLIVMIRSPIEMARSLHNEFVKIASEPVMDFERAWRLQERREQTNERREKHRPAFQYAKRASIGSQLQTLFETVPASQIHVIVYDDLIADALGTYHGVLDFLGLEHDVKTQLPIVNASVKYRSSAVQKCLISTRYWRERLGLPGGLGVNKAIDKINIRTGRQEIRPAFRRELNAYFYSEIELISRLLNRDFRFWLNASSRTDN